jgi:hypothetical protein
MTRMGIQPMPVPPAPKRPRGRPAKAAKAAVAGNKVADLAALLAGLDGLTLTSPARLSAEMYGRLAEDKAAARQAEREGQVHCPAWLDAQVRPTGVQGYPFVIETEDFLVKVAGEQQRTWPGVVVELRSHFLHMHPPGARSACVEALDWVCSQLLYDQEEAVRRDMTFAKVSVSRADLHIDWQGGWSPSFADGEERRFIRPRNAQWHPYLVGNHCQGYRFGTGNPVMARIYDKTAERAKRADLAYAELLASRNGERFDRGKHVWRLEFELHREAVASLKLAPESDAEDTEADVEAELSAEDLPHVGTLPKLFAHLDAIFQHLSYHWLRLVVPASGTIRSRWPLDPTWAALRREFAHVAQVAPLSPDALAVVRGARYAGRNRLLNRMAAGILASLDVADAEVAHVALMRLPDLVEQAIQKRAAREAVRLAQRRKALLVQLEQETPGGLDAMNEEELRARLAVIDAGRGLLDERPEVLRHRLAMLLGIWSAQGVLPLAIEPVLDMAALFHRHEADLSARAREKGGVPALLAQHYEKLFKVSAPADLFAGK